LSAEAAPAAAFPVAYSAITELLRLRTGLSCGSSRQAHLASGIGRAMARAGAASPRVYAEALHAERPDGGPLLDDLLGEVTVGETYFFREPGQFDFLRATVIPDLLRRRNDGSPLRVWSAGCATGEEPYSLAILLDQEGLGGRARILATDICRAAISKAHDGAYGKWSLRASDDAFIARYFARQKDRFQLDPRICERVSFRYLNLAFDSYPSFALDVWGMDLIFCRNVLIYLDEPTVATVAQCLLSTLAEGGWLIMGPSDPPLSDLAPFETVVTGAGVFYRRRDRAEASVSEGDPSPAAQTSALLPRSEKAVPRPRPVAVRPRAVFPRVPEPPPEKPEACVLRIKALANAAGAAEATEAAARDAARFPLSAELHFLHAVLLIGLGRDEEAAGVLRRVLYLDRSLAVAHFVVASLLARRGDGAGARAAYGKAHDLAARRNPEEPLSLSDGEPAGRLAEAAAVQMALIESAPEAAR
jgi:chemotaxis protein methyltransferase CheR